MPRADGVFVTDHPQKLVLEGSVANIPFISGVCDSSITVRTRINNDLAGLRRRGHVMDDESPQYNVSTARSLEEVHTLTSFRLT